MDKIYLGEKFENTLINHLLIRKKKNHLTKGFFTTQFILLKTLRNEPFENIVGKGENNGNYHFLLCTRYFLPLNNLLYFFSHIYFVICKCFQIGPVYFLCFGKELTLYHTITTFTTLKKKPFKNKTSWEKVKMLVTSIFSFFPQCFLSIPRRISVFELYSFCRLQMLSIWTSLKICHLLKS